MKFDQSTDKLPLDFPDMPVYARLVCHFFHRAYHVDWELAIEIIDAVEGQPVTTRKVFDGCCTKCGRRWITK